MRIILCLLLAVVVAMALTALHQRHRLERLTEEVAFTRDSVMQMQQQLQRQQQYSQELQGGQAAAVEQLVRNRLGWTADGEVVMRLNTANGETH
jgi:cell division protein FtsB